MQLKNYKLDNSLSFFFSHEEWPVVKIDRTADDAKIRDAKETLEQE